MTHQQTVLITGASSGLGFAFAQEFARKNFTIIMVSDDKRRLDTARNEITKIAKGSVHAIAINLAKPSSGEELYLKVKRENIAVDILINNAGFGTTGSLIGANLQEQIDQITLNSVTPTTLSMLFAKDMARRKSGKILNIASMAAFAPGPFMSVYYATKAYVLRFSTALDYELKDSNVTVSTFCPGPVATNFANRARATKTHLFSRRLPTASEVVKVAIEGLEENRRVIFDSRKNATMAFILKLLHLETVLRITTRLNR